MNIVCVDDEELVLSLTVSLCEKLEGTPHVEGFSSAKDTLDWIKEHKTDIAILDIDMPDMDGIKLAARIKKLSPDTAIIFLTGYDEYAVDAFKLHASGYLLKPVSEEELTYEVEYAMEGIRNRGYNQEKSNVFIQTFGEFDVFVGDTIVNFSRSRAKELLAYLVDKQGGSVTRGAAHAAIWEEGVYDRSMQKQLDVVIRSLRQTLEEYGISYIFELNKGSMRVIPDKFECDLYKFLKGDVDAINSYRGQYMSSYTWASLTEGHISNKD